MKWHTQNLRQMILIVGPSFWCASICIFNVSLVKLRLIAGLENNFPAALITKLVSVLMFQWARFTIKSTKVPVSNNNTNNGKKSILFNAFCIIANTWRSFELTGIRVHCLKKVMTLTNHKTNRSKSTLIYIGTDSWFSTKNTIQFQYNIFYM